MAKGKSQVASDSPSKPNPGGVTKSGKKSQSKSSKAGLTFPVARVNRRLIENKTTKRVGAGAPIYLTAVIEYFAAEILESAINQMRSDGKGRSRLTPTDVLQALRNDPALHKATNGLRVMVADKQKNAADMIICNTDMEKKALLKMKDSAWFEMEAGVDTSTNWKRYKKEDAERE